LETIYRLFSATSSDLTYELAVIADTFFVIITNRRLKNIEQLRFSVLPGAELRVAEPGFV
jgi:hypothetical protein